MPSCTCSVYQKPDVVTVYTCFKHLKLAQSYASGRPKAGVVWYCRIFRSWFSHSVLIAFGVDVVFLLFENVALSATKFGCFENSCKPLNKAFRAGH